MNLLKLKYKGNELKLLLIKRKIKNNIKAVKRTKLPLLLPKDIQFGYTVN